MGKFEKMIIKEKKEFGCNEIFCSFLSTIVYINSNVSTSSKELIKCEENVEDDKDE